MNPFDKKKRLKTGARVLLIAAATFLFSASRIFSQTYTDKGGTMMLMEDKTLPLVYISFVLKTGAALDPDGKEGLAELAAECLTKGTKTRTKEQIEEEIDLLGASISASVTHDYIIISGFSLSKNLDQFLDLYTDVILNPVFPEKEIEKEKRMMVSDLIELRNDNRQLARRFFREALFGNHPYGKFIDGKEKTINALTRADVEALYKTTFVKSNTLIAASGDFDKAWLEKTLNEKFAALSDGAVEQKALPGIAPIKGKKIILVHKPKQTEVQVVIGHAGMDIHSPDYFAFEAADETLGGFSFGARLMQEIRVKTGWSYFAYSYLIEKRYPDAFYFNMAPDIKNAVPTVKKVLEMYDDFKKKGITQTELDSTKKKLIASFPFMLDTTKKKMGQKLRNILLGLPENYLDTYKDNVAKVTLKDVQDSIAKYSDPDNLLIVLLCDTENPDIKIKDEMEKLVGKENVSVVDYTQE